MNTKELESKNKDSRDGGDYRDVVGSGKKIEEGMERLANKDKSFTENQNRSVSRQIKSE